MLCFTLPFEDEWGFPEQNGASCPPPFPLLFPSSPTVPPLLCFSLHSSQNHKGLGICCNLHLSMFAIISVLSLILCIYPHDTPGKVRRERVLIFTASLLYVTMGTREHICIHLHTCLEVFWICAFKWGTIPQGQFDARYGAEEEKRIVVDGTCWAGFTAMLGPSQTLVWWAGGEGTVSASGVTKISDSCDHHGS